MGQQVFRQFLGGHRKWQIFVLLLEFQSQPHSCYKGRPGKGGPSCSPVTLSAHYCNHDCFRFSLMTNHSAHRELGAREKWGTGKEGREIRLTGQIGVICTVGLCGQTKHVLENFVKQPLPLLWQFSKGSLVFLWHQLLSSYEGQTTQSPS